MDLSEEQWQVLVRLVEAQERTATALEEVAKSLEHLCREGIDVDGSINSYPMA